MTKIDLSKLRAIFGTLRPFSAMLWPVVITAAAALVITATILMGRGLRAKVHSESIPLGTQVKTMTDSAIPEAQVAIERQYEEAYRQDANQIERMAIESTQRELISYDIFPQPKDTSTLLFTGFGRDFRKKVDELVAKVNGRDCPGEEEVQLLIQKSSPVSAMSPSFSARFASSEQERLLEEFYIARAKSASVYVNPEDIAGYTFWGEYQYKNLEKGVKDCWDWQLGYWIAEDIFTTVEHINRGSGSVFTSPVKRIKAVGFIAPDKLFGGASRFGTKAGIEQEKPKYVIVPEDQMTEACTARVSNDDINVVHFSVILVLDTRAVLPFMKELCSIKEHKWRGNTGKEEEKIFKHNQITILESRIQSVRADAEDHYKYRYGPDAVAEMDLVCEYIFYKKGYKDINPDMYKKQDVKTATGEQV